MSKLLIFFTSSYPNSSEEVFVENEIRFLEKSFDKILIICATSNNNTTTRYIPKNADVIFFNDAVTLWKKISSFKFLFKKTFWNELKYNRTFLQIKFRRIHIKTLLIDLIKADLLCRFTNKMIKNQASFAQTHIYSYWSDYRAIACAMIKIQHPNYKVYARNHRWDLYFYANTPQYLPLRKYIFDHLDAVFCISDDGLDYLKKVLNFSHTTFKIARLGTINTQTEIRPYKELNPFLITSCSNLIPVKRVHLIIEALSLIKDRPTQWVHFGAGVLKSQLTDLAKKFLDKSNITYDFKGYVPNEELLSFYTDHQVDLFINVSESEGVPVSIMEAMSFGIPIIATAIGGTPEIVKDGFNGYLLLPNPTSEEIAETITKFYSLSVAEKLLMRQNAYNTWNEEYNAEKNYTTFVDQLFTI